MGLLQDVSEIAIADAMTQEVLVFDLNGTYLASRGRKGSGPGEFRAIRRLASLPGGAPGVWDAALGRVTILAQDGTVRSVTIGAAPGDRELLFIGALPDGRVLLRFDGSVAPMRSRSPGIVVDTVIFALHDAAGHDADTLAAIPGPAKWFCNSGKAWGVEGFIFDTELFAAVAGGRLLVGLGDQPELASYDVVGGPVQHVTIPFAGVAVDATDVARERAARVAAVKRPPFRLTEKRRGCD